MAQAFGFRITEIHDVMRAMRKSHFVKSMAGHGDDDEWQDVCNAPYRGFIIDLEFRSDVPTQFHVLLPKEV